MNSLVLDNISYTVDHKEVLKEITFSLKKGEFLNIVGPNGGGKTTLIELIIGLIKPTSGNITIHSEKIGYLPQVISSKRNFPMTVKEFLRLNVDNKKEDILSLSTKWLEKMNLVHHLNHNLSTLSGGQLQRLYLIRALINQPDLLILDEPTSALDPSFKKDFHLLLKDLQTIEKMTIINVTHHLDENFYDDSLTMYIDHKMTFFGSTERYLKEEHHV